MHNIIIVLTEHRESGKCNSDELVKIVECINPDVIFEEQPNDEIYREYYENENSTQLLEVLAIVKYKQNHDIIHIPVDKPINEYVSFQVHDFLNKGFKQNELYNKLTKEHCRLRNKYGFDFLNSERCSTLFEKIKHVEAQIINQSGKVKDKLLLLYDHFQEELNVREEAMLNNIYKFSKENQFNRAVFFVGFKHGMSIADKLSNPKPLVDGLKINWSFYSGSNQS